jgi:hypothetical protein
VREATNAIGVNLIWVEAGSANVAGVRTGNAGADTDNTIYQQPESAGLNAIAEGFRQMVITCPGDIEVPLRRPSQWLGCT